MLIKPHGGKLTKRILMGEELKEILARTREMVHVPMDEELVKDTKNICRGIYSPLEGFLNKLDLETVVGDCQLTSGLSWTIPVVLDVPDDLAGSIKEGDRICLDDERGTPIAVMHVTNKYSFDKRRLCREVFKTEEEAHPGVLGFYQRHDTFLGGTLDLLDNSKEPFYRYNLDPVETRILFKEKGWNTVVAFQTRNPIHRAHEYLQKCALEMVDGLFVNPVIGKKKVGDFTDEVILKSYEVMLEQFYPKDRSVMAILPMRMNYAGPREAIFHGIIRKNFGCTHLIIGRDHAGVGKYYGTYEAQEFFDQFPDLEIQALKYEHSFYCTKCGSLATAKTCPHSGDDIVPPSGTKIRELINRKELVPEEIMRREISELLINAEHPFVEG